MLKRQFIIGISIAVTILIAGPASADYIERECALIADKFDRVYKQNFQETQPAMAIIPFTSRLVDLQQRNIGFGISELLTGSLVNKRTFTVLERGQIEKVLDEQKLSLTGLTADSSLRVGELLGAKLIVTGTVGKIGEIYRMNCLLVSAENGTVLASYIADFKIDEFEKKAKGYIIPRKEAIGVYMGWRMIPISRVTNSPVTSENGIINANAMILTDILQSPAPGSRFYPVDNLVVDMSYVGSIFELSLDTKMAGSSDFQPMRDSTGYSDLILTASWVMPLNPGMDIFLGGGINYFSVIHYSNYSRIFPLATAGFEWRPWRNVGFALWVYYRFGTDIVSLSVGRFDTPIPPMPIFQWSPVSIMPVASFYF